MAAVQNPPPPPECNWDKFQRTILTSLTMENPHISDDLSFPTEIHEFLDCSFPIVVPSRGHHKIHHPFPIKKLMKRGLDPATHHFLDLSRRDPPPARKIPVYHVSPFFFRREERKEERKRCDGSSWYFEQWRINIRRVFSTVSVPGEDVRRRRRGEIAKSLWKINGERHNVIYCCTFVINRCSLPQGNTLSIFLHFDARARSR